MTTKTNQNQVSNQVASQAVVFEALEGRQMMSVSHHHHPIAKPVAPVTPAPKIVVPVAPAATAAVTIAQSNGVLQVTGTTGNDQILISQSGTTFTITNGSWSTKVTGTFTKVVVRGNGGNDSITIDPSVTEAATLYGGAGSDTLIGNNGSDTFYAGAGTNVMKGGTGANVFVTLGSRGDTITGGQGNDSFWMDSNTGTELVTDLTPAQNAAGRVHRIASFLGGVATSLTGQTFAEPALTDSTMVYKNFSNLPLFSNDGPSENDINQGYLGDCWYLSSLSSVAKADAAKIRQSVVDLGDGTYAVQFSKNGQSVFVRVDGNLPTWSNGQAAYANVTNSKGTSALWVAIMEKAMAEFDGSASTYSNIDGGWMSTAYNALGLNNGGIWASSATDLVNQLSSALAAGEAVTIGLGTPPAGAPLIGDHAYTVDHVTRDAKGNIVSVTLRNPWGVDGAGNDGIDDGYVTVTPAQLYAAQMGACTANA
jgi:hypothetical protein